MHSGVLCNSLELSLDFNWFSLQQWVFDTSLQKIASVIPTTAVKESAKVHGPLAYYLHHSWLWNHIVILTVKIMYLFIHLSEWQVLETSACFMITGTLRKIHCYWIPWVGVSGTNKHDKDISLPSPGSQWPLVSVVCCSGSLGKWTRTREVLSNELSMRTNTHWHWYYPRTVSKAEFPTCYHFRSRGKLGPWENERLQLGD